MAILANSVYAGRHPLGMTAPAIISQEIFERAQRLRSTNKRMHPPRKDTWPLQNLLRCSLSGSRIKGYLPGNGQPASLGVEMLAGEQVAPL